MAVSTTSPLEWKSSKNSLYCLKLRARFSLIQIEQFIWSLLHTCASEGLKKELKGNLIEFLEKELRNLMI